MTLNPASASLQARVPPPAPVPTITKSTSSSPYSRIGTQPPGSNTSGARPLVARGEICAASGMVPRQALERLAGLDRFPRIAPVDARADVAARRGRAAEAHRAP